MSLSDGGNILGEICDEKNNVKICYFKRYLFLISWVLELYNVLFLSIVG